MNTTEQIHQEDLQRLKSLRYMDDDFMTVCLADNFEGVELILRIVLGLENIKIKSVRTQEPMKNLQGRSATLDVHAVDSANKEFDVEMNYEALAKKARYFKKDEKGVATMCKIMEDMRNEATRDKLKEKAILMLKNGKISLDEIQIFFSELSNEEIEEVKTEVMQLV